MELYMLHVRNVKEPQTSRLWEIKIYYGKIIDRKQETNIYKHLRSQYALQKREPGLQLIQMSKTLHYKNR